MIPRPKSGAADSLRILLVGDCMLGRGVDQALRQHKPDFPWGDTLPIFHEADLRLCNLECVISDLGEPWSEYEKAFHFRSSARNVAALRAAGINLVSLANNHVLDYGYEALREMLEILDRAGIAHSGAGVDLEEATRVARVDIHGWRLGFLAFTDNEPSWEAMSQRPGVFYAPVSLDDLRARHLIEVVRNSEDLDLLIVSAHWGSNWGYTPPPEHIALAHALIDAGADVIFGHSSHVFRGIEFYRDRPILYGTGDFVDDYAVDPVERNDESFTFLLQYDQSGRGTMQLRPTRIGSCQSRIALPDEAQEIAAKMQKLCADLGASTKWDPVRQCLNVSPPPQARTSSM
jgi:poly-gamma-glutamate capsule biosynthesis protein CapA/YwtB (metallophosphatase superfamily)